jgi:hypothetical protein
MLRLMQANAMCNFSSFHAVAIAIKMQLFSALSAAINPRKRPLGDSGIQFCDTSARSVSAIQESLR